MHHKFYWYPFHVASQEGLQPVHQEETGHLYCMQFLEVTCSPCHCLENNHTLHHPCPIHLMSIS